MRIIIKEATAFGIAADIASRTSFDRKLTPEEEQAKKGQEEEKKRAKEEQEKTIQIEERSKKIIEFVKQEKQSGFIQSAIKKWNQIWHNHVSPNKIAQFGDITDFRRVATNKGYQYNVAENYILIHKSFDLGEEQNFTIVYYFPSFLRNIVSYVKDWYDFDLAEKFNSNFEPQQIIGIKNVAYQCYINPKGLEVNEQVKNLLQKNEGTLLINPFKRAAVRKIVPTPKPAPLPTSDLLESVFDRWKLLASIK